MIMDLASLVSPLMDLALLVSPLKVSRFLNPYESTSTLKPRYQLYSTSLQSSDTSKKIKKIILDI